MDEEGTRNEPGSQPFSGCATPQPWIGLESEMINSPVEALAKRTQAEVVLALSMGDMSIPDLVEQVVAKDDRSYTGDGVRGAICTLLNRECIVMRKGLIGLPRLDLGGGS